MYRSVLLLTALLYLAGWPGLVLGQVEVESPPELDRALYDYAQSQQPEEEIEGWAILLALNRDRIRIDDLLTEAKWRYPSLRDDLEWQFDNPYYRIIIGAFIDKKSAMPWLAKIRKDYSSAFLVRSRFQRKEVIAFRRKMPL